MSEENRCPYHNTPSKFTTNEHYGIRSSLESSHRYSEAHLNNTRKWIINNGGVFAELVVQNLLDITSNWDEELDGETIESYIANIFINLYSLSVDKDGLKNFSKFIRGDYPILEETNVPFELLAIIGEYGLINSLAFHISFIIDNLYVELIDQKLFNQTTLNRCQILIKSQKLQLVNSEQLFNLIKKQATIDRFKNGNISCIGKGYSERFLFLFISNFILKYGYGSEKLLKYSNDFSKMKKDFDQYA